MGTDLPQPSTKEVLNAPVGQGEGLPQKKETRKLSGKSHLPAQTTHWTLTLVGRPGRVVTDVQVAIATDLFFTAS